jgi:pyruvate kinase
LRQALKNKGPDYRCAIMLDTKGPEVRTGKLKNKTVRLEAGKEIKVCVDTSLQGDENMIAIDYKELATSVKVGGKILIADGTISLTGNPILSSALLSSISVPYSTFSKYLLYILIIVVVSINPHTLRHTLYPLIALYN